jgi:ribosomal protein L18E
MGGLGCDNMTCVLVCLLHDQPYQVMVERCARLAREREEEIRRKVAEELEQGGDEREEVET